MKDYIFIIVAVIVLVLKMVDANKKQKAEAEKRALDQQRRRAEAEGNTIPSYTPEPVQPTLEEVIRREIFGELRPITVPEPAETEADSPLETVYEAEPFKEEAQSQEEYIPEHPSKLQTTLPQFRTSMMTSLESLRVDEGDMNALADNSAWEVQVQEELENFDLRAAIIYSEILKRPYAS